MIRYTNRAGSRIDIYTGNLSPGQKKAGFRPGRASENSIADIVDALPVGCIGENGNGKVDEGEILEASSDPSDVTGHAHIRLVYPATFLKDDSGNVIASEKEFHYVLRENIPDEKLIGMTYSSEEIPITVKVYDKLDGSVGAKVYKTGASDDIIAASDDTYSNSDDEPHVITNVYELSPAKLTFSGIKTLSGRAIKEGEFSFLLYTTQSDFDISSLTAQSVSNTDVSGQVYDAFTFPEITYSAAGTYYYVIAEDASSALDNVTYDNSAYRVTVAVGKKDGAAELEIKSISYEKGTLENGSFASLGSAANAQDGAFASFANAYAADPVIHEDIVGVKMLSGRPMADNEFVFDLYESDSSFDISSASVMAGYDNIPAVKANASDAHASFKISGLTFDAAGDYYYIVKEGASDALPGVLYDDAVYNIKITVSQRTETTSAGKIGELYIEDTVIADGTGAPAANGEIKFNNTYSETPAMADISFTKSLTGRAMGAQEFEFVLNTAVKNGNVLTVYGEETSAKNTSSGENSPVNMSVEVTGAGEKWYVLSEKTGLSDRMTYDPTVYAVCIASSVTNAVTNVDSVKYYDFDSASGEIGAEKSSVTFVNDYAVKAAKADISFTKTITGREMIAEEFEFVLKEAELNANGNALLVKGEAASAKNASPGSSSNVNMSVEIPDAGEYWFVLSEKAGSDAAVKYDNAYYAVLVKVSVDAAADTVIDSVEFYEYNEVSGETGNKLNSVTFENEYAVKPQTAEVPFVKNLSGRDMEAGEFEFVLESAELNSNGNALIVHGEIASGSNLDEGSSSSVNIEVDITGAGDHWFVLSEKAGSQSGITYDTVKYAVCMTSVVNTLGETVVENILFFAYDPSTGIVGAAVTDAEFNNVYTPPTTPPAVTPGGSVSTGDGFSPVLWIVLMAVSLVLVPAAVLLAVFVKKKEK